MLPHLADELLRLHFTGKVDPNNAPQGSNADKGVALHLARVRLDQLNIPSPEEYDPRIRFGFEVTVWPDFSRVANNSVARFARAHEHIETRHQDQDDDEYGCDLFRTSLRLRGYPSSMSVPEPLILASSFGVSFFNVKGK